MKSRTLFLLLLMVAIAGFVALNWTTFTQPSSLSLGIATIEAPLGLIMLGVLVALTMIFLGFVASLQTSVMKESRQHAREIQSHRELADQAEASRFTELRRYVESELQTIESKQAENHATLLTRLDHLDESMRKGQEHSNNILATYIGELEDRLDRTVLEPSAYPDEQRH